MGGKLPLQNNELEKLSLQKLGLQVICFLIPEAVRSCYDKRLTTSNNHLSRKREYWNYCDHRFDRHQKWGIMITWHEYS